MRSHARTLLLALLITIGTLALACQPSSAGLCAAIDIYPISTLYREQITSLYNVTVNDVPIDIVDNVNYAHGHFGMGDGTATVVVTFIDGQPVLPGSVRISPEKLNVKYQIKGNQLVFPLPHNGYYIVKVLKRKELVLIADPQETNPPEKRGDGIWNVVEDYGADPLGGENSSMKTTQAFQQAIDHASGNYSSLIKQGSYPHATVHVPKGQYMLRNIVLKSNVALYLAPGAVLRFTGVRADYTHHWFKKSMQRDITWWIRTDFNSNNIKFHGRGWVDGNGKTAHDVGKIANNLLVPIWTDNFVAEGILFRNSAAWAITPIRTRNLFMANVKVLNRLDMGENDGFDIMHSTNTTVRHTLAISLDDPYSTKTWVQPSDDITRSWPPNTSVAQSNVVFEDSLAWTRCFGFKIGQGVNTDQTNITFRTGVVYQAALGIGINHRWGTATVRTARFEDIDIEDTSLRLENRSSWQALFTQGADGRGGLVDGVTIKDMVVRRAGQTHAQVNGMSDKLPIKNLLYKHVRMPFPGTGGKLATTLMELNVTNPWFVKDVRVEA